MAAGARSAHLVRDLCCIPGVHFHTLKQSHKDEY